MQELKLSYENTPTLYKLLHDAWQREQKFNIQFELEQQGDEGSKIEAACN